MRIQDWSKLIWGLMLTLTATVALAQEPGYAVDPGSSQEMYEPYGAANYGASGYGAIHMDPQMAPPPPGYAMDPHMGGGYGPGSGGGDGLAPYPHISPYDHAFEQTVNEDGLWMRFINDERKKWFANVQYVGLFYKKPGGAGNDPDKQIGFGITLNPSNTFQIHRLDAITDDLFTNGFMGTYGFINQDSTGAELSAFYGSDPDEDIDFPQRTFFPTSNPTRFARINRVRLADGRISDDPLVFNQGLTARYGASAYGVEGNALTMPFLGRGANMMQMLYGMRYMGVNERLSITGNDTTTKFTFIDVDVTSHLVGPQAGVRWNLGGERFKLRSFFNAGALVNMDNRSIRFVNYGGANDPTGPKSGDMDQRNTHISPMIELGIQAEAPLFSYLPFINRVPLIREGVFLIGYKWTNVYLMDRPADSITYGDPVPQIDTDREEWSLKSATFGIQWTW